MRSRLLAAFAALCCVPAANALLMRADRDEAEYRELATHYSAAIALAPGAGEGVLIAPRWILTLAANAQALAKARASAIEIAGRRHAIAATVLPTEAEARAGNDVALVFLAEPVADVDPLPIHRAADEQGKGIVIVAHGPGGRIGAAPTLEAAARASINTVDRVSPGTIETRLKSGDDASDLQGALAAAELGAVAFVETPAGLEAAGLARAPLAGAEGSWQPFARVSAHAEWIEASMFRAAADAAAAATKRR